MKKTRILLFAVAGMLMTLTAFSQAQVGIGIKGGLNFANINTTTSIAANYENRTGYHFGAYALFKFTKIGIQPELLYSKQGTTVTFSTSNLDANYDYIAIPVILKLYLVGGLNLQAGVQFGFLGSSTGDVLDTASGAIATNQSLSSYMTSSDFSVPVGIGLDLPFGLNVTGRYNIGVSDVNAKTGTVNPALVSALGTNAAKNQVFQVSVGFRLFKFGS